MGDLPRSTKPNFYSVLGIPKSASLYDISKAYKSLVMKWHPDKHTTNKAEAEAQFKTITEAYRVLSSKKRDESAIPTFVDEPKTPKTPKAPKTPEPKAPKVARKVTFQVQDKDDDGFDSSPMFISRSESHNTPLTTSNPSTPKGDPPLSRVGTRRSSNTPIIYSQTTTRKKPQPIEKKLECTLEELWRGCVKKIKITRDVISETGLIVQEEEILKIRVKPGWKKGTKITFEGKGDERPGSLPADIIFIIDEKRHSMFKREGEDLELGVEVPLVQALTGCTISVPLLGGEQMTMSFDNILYPGYEKIILGQGMPKSKEEGMRGDLRLKFLVRFPAELSDEQRSDILNVLKDCS